MTVYIDLIFFINLAYDFLLLLTTGIVLKRKIKIYRCILASLLGAISIFLLWVPFSELILFTLKIIVSILMCVITFKFISVKYTINNILYLYMCSIILAGFLYYLNLEFSLKRYGLLFVFDGISMNYLALLILAPIILFFYIKSSKKLKSSYNLYYHIDIVFDDYKISCLALFDSGNSLKDIITGKPVLIVKSNLLKGIYNIRSPMYIPYNTISGSSIMKCYKPSYIILNNKKIYNYLIGEGDYKFSDGVECILNVKLMEDNYV